MFLLIAFAINPLLMFEVPIRYMLSPAPQAGCAFSQAGRVYFNEL
jgi:hypothetical protein